jgi:acid stress chaperone HdeB
MLGSWPTAPPGKVSTEEDPGMISRVISTIALIGFISPAVAMEMDMSTMTCKDIASMDSDTKLAVIIWMSGYAHGKSNNAKIDSTKMHDNALKIVDFCKKDPNATIMSGLEQLNPSSTV